MNETALSRCAMRSRRLLLCARTHALAGCSFSDFAFALCSYGQLLLTSAAQSQVIYEKSRADLHEKDAQAPTHPSPTATVEVFAEKHNIYSFWTFEVEPNCGEKNHPFGARITVVCLVWISAHGSPHHRGASQGYRGWGDRRLSR